MAAGAFLLLGTPGSGGSTPPATPLLTVADNGDGSGAVATVTGSAGGSSNAVDVVGLGPTGARTWSTFGPRTGDGTVALSLADGPYVAICYSTLAGLPSVPSQPYEFTVTGGGNYNSPHAALAHSVHNTIVGLIGTKLLGIAADSVRVRKVPSAQDFSGTSPLPAGLHAYPGILIVYYDRERDEGGVNDRDDIGYPLLIVFAAKDVDAQGRSDPEANDDQYLTWRQVISDTFRNQPYQITNYAKGAITFQTCTLEYGPIEDWKRWQQDQIFAGSFSLVFELRKGRGPNPVN